MKGRQRLAGVSKSDQDIILGHSSGSVGEDYGGDEARLEVAAKALLRALAEPHATAIFPASSVELP